MVIMTLRLTVRPEKKTDAISIINAMAGPILVEPRCKHFCLYSDVNNDDTLMLVQEWVSQEALEEHIRSDEFNKILVVIELATRAPEIRFNTVSDIAGFELIENLRTQHTSAAQI